MKYDCQRFPDFTESLQNDSLVFLFGAGFSTVLSGRKYTWSDWIADGLSRMRDRSAAAQLAQSLRDDTTADNMVRIVGEVLRTLKSEGSYTAWMDAAFGSAEIANSAAGETLKKLQRTQCVFATTNYDRLLEAATGLAPLSYDEPAAAFEMLEKNISTHILHIHGLYDTENGKDNIIADAAQYDAVMANQGAQFIQGLLGTRTLIFVGCGKTTEDANISRFIRFATEQLKMERRYYFLCRNGEEPAGLPENITAIPYGDSYADLPDFLEELAQLRLHSFVSCRAIIGLSPYRTVERGADALQRYHFSLRALPFCGRTAELALLEDFLRQDRPFSWWSITGQAGSGKSRLALELLKRMSADWFGFFLNDNAKSSDLDSFLPFTNTVIVIDYVSGRESFAADAIRRLQAVFTGTAYKLRILLLERDSARDAGSWYHKLLRQYGRYDASALEESAFRPDFLVLGDLDRPSVEQLIGEVCEQKGLAASEAVNRELCDTYAEKFERLRFRPLFVQLFAEAWIENDFHIPRYDSFEALLSALLEREQERWLELLGHDQRCCNAFLRLLLRANISGKLLPEQLPEYYREDWAVIEAYSRDHTFPGAQGAGERRAVLSALCQSLDGENTAFEPLYPDLIKEYMFCCYAEEERLRPMLDELWQNEAERFSIFLTRCLTDFPENPFYRRVLKLYDETTQNQDILIGRLAMLRKRERQRGDDPAVLTAIIDNEYAFWRQVKVPDDASEQEGLALLKLFGLALTAQQYALWSLYEVSHVMDALEDMTAIPGGEAVQEMKRYFLTEFINALSQHGFSDEASVLIRMAGELPAVSGDDDELAGTYKMTTRNAELINLLLAGRLDRAERILERMRKECDYRSQHAVRILMLSHRNLIDLSFRAEREDLIDRTLPHAEKLAATYPEDTDIQAKLLLCRLYKLQSAYFGREERHDFEAELSRLEPQFPLTDYGKPYDASEYLGAAWGTVSVFKLNFIGSDAQKLTELIEHARQILALNPSLSDVAVAMIQAQRVLHKNILCRKLGRETVEEAFEYVEKTPESESLRGAFFQMLEESEERTNRSKYLTKAVLTNARQDARYNPFSDGGVEEAADYEDAMRALIAGNSPQGTYRRAHKKVGPNEPCPCGSGKKFKKCCRGNGRYD